MADRHKPLMVPPAAETDDQAIEMARVWIANGGLHCVLNVGHWHRSSETSEPHAWGIVLADMAQHISNALEEATGLERRETLNAVVKAFHTEIQHKTSSHTGQWPTMDDPATEFWDESET